MVDNELLQTFLVESAENLALLDRELAVLKKDPGAHASLASSFRAVHTIKGTCGFYGLARLDALTRAGEGLLLRLRDGELELTRSRIVALEAMISGVRAILASVEAEGTEGGTDTGALVEALMRGATTVLADDAGDGLVLFSDPPSAAPV